VEFHCGGADRETRLAAVRPCLARFREAAVDSVVLGCTHFLFLIDEFRAAALPDITIYDSMEGISNRVESILDAEGGRLRAAGEAGAGDSLFVVTEEAGLASWRDRALGLGARLCTLDDLKARRGP
jgi:glutamate racemase